MRGGIIRGALRRIGLAMSAQIVSDDAEAPPQRPDLVEPHALAAGEAVQQQHRRPGAGIADGNGKIADLDFAHAAVPIGLKQILLSFPRKRDKFKTIVGTELGRFF